MDIKESLKAIPELVAMLKAKFSGEVAQNFKDMKLEDGTIIRYEGDMPEKGMPIFVLNEAGEQLPLPDGEYLNPEDGSVIIVMGGIISDVKAKEAEVEAPAEEAVMSEAKPMGEADVKRIVESIVKETIFSKEEIESFTNTLKAENESLKKDLEIQKELLKETFAIVEKIASSPSEPSKHEKKDGFKKVESYEINIDEFRKKYLTTKF